MKSSIDSIYVKRDFFRIGQGDILSDIEYIFKVEEVEDDGKKKLQTTTKTFPYLVILSQECDLEQDYINRIQPKDDKHDKYIHSILVAPAYISEELRAGIHLSELSLKMEKYNSKSWPHIIENNNIRYHFLQSNSELRIQELIIDFKHFYTMDRDFLYSVAKKHYMASLNELFREQLSQRFAHYLSRIGVPDFLVEKKSSVGEIPEKGLEAPITPVG